MSYKQRRWYLPTLRLLLGPLAVELDKDMIAGNVRSLKIIAGSIMIIKAAGKAVWKSQWMHLQREARL